MVRTRQTARGRQEVEQTMEIESVPVLPYSTHSHIPWPLHGQTQTNQPAAAADTLFSSLLQAIVAADVDTTWQILTKVIVPGSSLQGQGQPTVPLPAWAYPLSLAVETNVTDLVLLVWGSVGASVADQRRALHTAIRSHDMAMLQVLIEAGVGEGGRGMECIHAAVTNGAHQCMKYLVEAGFDINDKDGQGMTPLARAIKTHQRETVVELLNLGANPFVYDASWGIPWIQALMLGYNDIAELMDPLELMNLMEIDEPINADRQTLLHLAVQCGHLESVQRLVQAGANLGVQDCQGFTPLMTSFKSPNHAVSKFLLSAGDYDIHARDAAGKTVFHHGLDLQYSPHMCDILTTLLSRGHKVNTPYPDGSSPLLHHCHHRHKVTWLIEHSCNMNTVSPSGDNLLWSAVRRACTGASMRDESLLDYVLEHNIDMELSAIARPHVGDNGEERLLTPLQHAIESRSISVAWKLFYAGAKLTNMTHWLSSLGVQQLQRAATDQPAYDDEYWYDSQSSPELLIAKQCVTLIERIEQHLSQPASLLAVSRQHVLPLLGHNDPHRVLNSLPLPRMVKNYVDPSAHAGQAWLNDIITMPTIYSHKPDSLRAP